MQMCPAYTVRRIRDELSWRQVNLLIAQGDSQMSSWQLLTRIEKVVVKYTGARFASSRPLTDDELLAAVQDLPLG